MDSVDAWLVGQTSLVIVRRKALLPVLRERQQLADSLARILGQLGLERRPRQTPTLGAYLASRRPAPQPTAAQDEAETAPTSEEVERVADAAPDGSNPPEQ